MTKITVDESTCIGCGVCAQLCDTVFEISAEHGKSIVIKQPSNKEENDCADQALAACPVAAINRN